MRAFGIWVNAALAAAAHISSPELIDRDQGQIPLGSKDGKHGLTSIADDNAIEEVQRQADLARQIQLEILDARSTKTGHRCTRENIRVRREWGSLSRDDRLAYIDAVKCMMHNPPHYPALIAPGSKSRFDDFVATHIDLGKQVHYSGTFIPWHRYFTWAFEEAIINECGWTQGVPYWDWTKDARDGFGKSPVFDGSDTSFSGNGERIEQHGQVLYHGTIYVGLGTGGGCIPDGPFKNLTINMGPADLALPDNGSLAMPDPLQYNPRCLTRSFTQELLTQYCNATQIVDVLSNNEYHDFAWAFMGVPGSTNIGFHSGGHYSLGGDPGRDYLLSPSDPVFYLHHSMADRVWWMWQTMDHENRTIGDNAIDGYTTTLAYRPIGDAVTFDTAFALTYTGAPNTTVRDIISTTDGLLCYMYE